MDAALYPLIFEPIYRNYLWGGRRIPRLFGRELPRGIYAESWEIADRPEAMSRVANGPLIGMTLRELRRRYGSRLIGRAGVEGPFPLIFKILDAAQRTSLQVHPGEAHAVQIGGEPKTEFWYALPGMSEQHLFIGLRPGTVPALFEEALRQKRVERLLRVVPVQAGDAFFIPGGRIHAVDAGCLFFEIQQNSDTTYRVFDWDRLDEHGRCRPLHIEEALQVIEWDDCEDPRVTPERIDRADGNVWRLLKACKHFRIERLDLLRDTTLNSDGRSFRVVFVAAGRLVAEGGGERLPLRSGMTCLLPATLESCRLLPEGRRKPPAELLLIEL
ncbi:MAG: class I mannose-6-phosphate isomerase [Candidatus Eisenbacteria sp.]|nr:class I mannose-6-phosphate isomerase [Candidatus Eisenbacteria bacterium]